MVNCNFFLKKCKLSIEIKVWENDVCRSGLKSLIWPVCTATEHRCVIQISRRCFCPSYWRRNCKSSRKEYKTKYFRHHDLFLLWKLLLIFQKTDKISYNFFSRMHTVRTETHQSTGLLPYNESALTIFVASLVKHAGMHCDSVLPYFYFYGANSYTLLLQRWQW